MYVINPPLPAVCQDALARIAHARNRHRDLSPELSESLDTVMEGLRTSLTLFELEGWGEQEGQQ